MNLALLGLLPVRIAWGPKGRIKARVARIVGRLERDGEQDWIVGFLSSILTQRPRALSETYIRKSLDTFITTNSSDGLMSLALACAGSGYNRSANRILDHLVERHPLDLSQLDEARSSLSLGLRRATLELDYPSLHIEGGISDLLDAFMSGHVPCGISSLSHHSERIEKIIVQKFGPERGKLVFNSFKARCNIEMRQ